MSAALAVMAATAAVGALRYPGLPAHIVTGSGHRVPKSVVSVLVVAGQLYFTAVYSGLMLIVHRSRPDIEAADPAASTLRYRRFLAATTRALLTMAALADLGLLLAAVAARAGQGGSRLNGNVRGLALAAGTDRDDDRFWKAGLLYANRDDPAIVVGARFGDGWALNFGNPVAWLIITGTVAAWAGLAVIGAAPLSGEDGEVRASRACSSRLARTQAVADFPVALNARCRVRTETLSLRASSAVERSGSASSCSARSFAARASEGDNRGSAASNPPCVTAVASSTRTLRAAQTPAGPRPASSEWIMLACASSSLTSAASAGPVTARFPSIGVSAAPGRTMTCAVVSGTVAKWGSRPACRRRNRPAGTVCSLLPRESPSAQAPRWTIHSRTWSWRETVADPGPPLAFEAAVPRCRSRRVAETGRERTCLRIVHRLPFASRLSPMFCPADAAVLSRVMPVFLGFGVRRLREIYQEVIVQQQNPGQRIPGRVAVITGAGGGLGVPVAHRFAADGYTTVLVGRTENTLREAAESGPAGADMHP
jgi:hypothetical protein